MKVPGLDWKRIASEQDAEITQLRWLNHEERKTTIEHLSSLIVRAANALEYRQPRDPEDTTLVKELREAIE